VTEVLAFSGKIYIYVFGYVNNLDPGNAKAFSALVCQWRGLCPISYKDKEKSLVYLNKSECVPVLVRITSSGREL
jgi:hypothetical protein